MRVLVTGASGQLGCALRDTVPAQIECTALDKANFDIVDTGAVEKIVSELRPDCILNAAAYTAVDKAEDEPERAFAVNHTGAANLARAARQTGARLTHVSTDYVFDGRASRPYLPDDPPNPINVYGRSKLAGEQAVQEILPPEHFLIVRTAWVYALPGRNFVTTMLRLLDEREGLRVVCDQIGSPTAAAALAAALWRAIERELSGLHHWTDAGVASWYDFAVAIQSVALAQGMLTQAIPIRPIDSAAFPTKAERAKFNILDKQNTWESLGFTAEHWQQALRRTLTAANHKTSY